MCYAAAAAIAVASYSKVFNSGEGGRVGRRENGGKGSGRALPAASPAGASGASAKTTNFVVVLFGGWELHQWIGTLPSTRGVHAGRLANVARYCNIEFVEGWKGEVREDKE